MPSEMTLQVLVATMHQTNFQVAERMNLKCRAVLANQADRAEIFRHDGEDGDWLMITTPTRGVGLNRNIALLASDADILIFGDDDMVYNDGMPEAVIEAFRQNPRADVMLFGLNITKDGMIVERRETPTRRVYMWNSMRYGTCRIAVRRKAILDHNITFHQSFGGGCVFSAGEDSLFLKACFDAGLKVYSHSYVLGNCAKDTSTWFVGYNEKYFYDKGVLVRKLFPRSAYLMALYFGLHFKRSTSLTPLKRLRLVYAGVRGGRKMIPYPGEK